MIISHSSLFNKETLNIFTDASITNVEGETIGCSGAVVVATNEINNQVILNETFSINRLSTNNDSELKAIHLGLMKALNYRNQFKTINLFSDSRISIQGIREWIFNWVTDNGILYGSSGQVKNQELIKSIVSTIYHNKLNINLYYQKGHVKLHDDESLMYAKNNFEKFNNLPNTSMEIIRTISYFNDVVDNDSRTSLGYYVDNLRREGYNNPTINNRAIAFDINAIDFNMYKNLILGGK